MSRVPFLQAILAIIRVPPSVCVCMYGGYSSQLPAALAKCLQQHLVAVTAHRKSTFCPDCIERYTVGVWATKCRCNGGNFTDYCQCSTDFLLVFVLRFEVALFGAVMSLLWPCPAASLGVVQNGAA